MKRTVRNKRILIPKIHNRSTILTDLTIVAESFEIIINR